eukprot:COSAG02_NODE_391_length_23237_cov_42.467672_7_plen_136_part_00
MYTACPSPPLFALRSTPTDHSPRRGALASTHGASIRARFRCSAAASQSLRRFRWVGCKPSSDSVIEPTQLDAFDIGDLWDGTGQHDSNVLNTEPNPVSTDRDSTSVSKSVAWTQSGQTESSVQAELARPGKRARA